MKHPKFEPIFLILIIYDIYSVYSIKKFDNLEHNIPNNERFYRGLLLDNELKVMLISDPSTQKAAASLTVGVGSLNDSKDLDGLANLAGYSLLKRSDKYSEQNEYLTFLIASGATGDSFQQTFGDHQVFSFDVDPAHLVPALDRLAHFFYPSSLKNLNDDDINASILNVHFEYIGRKKVDDFRVQEVEKLLSKKRHKYNHFFTGNIRTFSQESHLHSHLVAFRSQWYSSNIMYLAVLGKESLDFLEGQVIEMFGKIVNKEVKPKFYKYPEEHPWGPGQLKRKVLVVPLDSSYKRLRLNFPISLDILLHQRETEPEAYVSYLLSRSGPGSLLSVLKKRNLCTSLQTEPSYIQAGIAFFTITCFLTDYGVTQSGVDEIIDLIFQYLSFLLSNGVRNDIFNDLRKIKEINYRNAPPIEPLKFVELISEALQIYPIDKVLLPICSPPFFWKPSLISNFILDLTPDTINVTVVSKSFENENFRQREKHYRTPYKIEEIEEKIIDRWYSSEISDEFCIPSPNKFLPSNLTLYPLDEDVNSEKNHRPYPIYWSPNIHVWFKQDEKFRTPWLHIWIRIIKPTVHLQNPISIAVWYTYWILIKRMLKFHFLDAEQAGFKYTFSPTDYGMTVHIYGFNDTMSLFMHEFLLKINNLNADLKKEDFQLVKRTYINNLKNRESPDLESQSVWYSTTVFIADELLQDTLIAAAYEMQYDDFLKCTRKIFSNVLIQALVYGNYTEEKAIDIANMLKNQFKSERPLLAQELLKSRTVEMRDGSNLIYQTIKKGQSGTLYLVFYQFRSAIVSSMKNIMTRRLLSRIISTWFSNIFARSLLGWYLAEVQRDDNVLGVVFTVNSIESLEIVINSIEKFLGFVPRMLETMTNEKFNRYKEEYREECRGAVEPTDLKLSDHFWNQIVGQFYQFDKTERELALLELVEKADLMTFFADHLNITSPRLSKLIIRLFPEGTSSEIMNDIPAGITKIDDFGTFKKMSTLLPVNVF